MSKLLLLYDTDDKDFARDVEGLLCALDVDAVMIPRAPDGGTTLQQKEADFFASVEGALFLITPGSERHGRAYPSPSVADEMGQARERFKAEPWRVMYLVDARCNLQAIDQRAYIQFSREDHRTIVEAVRLLVLALKDAGILAGQLPAAATPPPSIDIPGLAKAIPSNQRELLMDLSRRPRGAMFHSEFIKMASLRMRNETDGNLAVHDLYRLGVVTYSGPVNGLGGTDSTWLSALGWEVIRLLRAEERTAEVVRRAAEQLARIKLQRPQR